MAVSRSGRLAIMAIAACLAVLPFGGTDARAVGTTAVPAVTGLDFPAGFTIAPDGRFFAAEMRTGVIRVISANGASSHIFFSLPQPVRDPEMSLLSLALHPDYPAKPYLYASVVRTVSGAVRSQVLRLTDRAGVGSGLTVLFDRPAGGNHNGGRIVFGPDKQLYLVIGDHKSSANAQNLGNAFGKILRMTATGGIPAGNPFGSVVWAYGYRNSIGMAFDPATGRLWSTDNGPGCNDEVNLIVKGGNYGWGPTKTCDGQSPQNTNHDGPNPLLPKAWFTPNIAPTGIAFCAGCGLPSGEGALYFGAWNTGQIRRATPNAARNAIASMAVPYTHTSGVLGLERGPGGVLYFSDATGIWRLTAS